jgi:serine protease AprX
MPDEDGPVKDEHPLKTELVYQSTISDAFRDERVVHDLDADEDGRIPAVIELNLLHAEGLPGARSALAPLLEPFPASPRPVAGTYVAVRLTIDEIERLVTADQAARGPSERAIYRIWPDFPVKPLIYRSVATVKADAARNAFEASGREITWAVIDSGIDARHLHFEHGTLAGEVANLHKDFTDEQGDPLTDAHGHGTHVAGIIAGWLAEGRTPFVGERVADKDGKHIHLEERDIGPHARLRGVAPECKLVSLKVLDGQGKGDSTRILEALEYVRERNGDGKLLQIHGVNMSLGYEFDPQWFACGQSPICVEVDRLVKSGVVVVIAAGNTGWGTQGSEARRTNTGLTLTINDPGNAALGITVGATHRDSPHMYGVSYFSSKGPTGDGRLKPDLVAPGERITSCAAGRRLDLLAPLGEPDPKVSYIDDTGTSAAAPHVSGAIAAFLSVRREFIGRPEEVKRIFLDSAMSLGRERYFEGHGMVDLMRAIQAV